MPCRITPHQEEQWRIRREQLRIEEELKQRIRQRRERLQQTGLEIERKPPALRYQLARPRRG